MSLRSQECLFGNRDTIKLRLESRFEQFCGKSKANNT